jgi:hypothetical protein
MSFTPLFGSICCATHAGVKSYSEFTRSKQEHRKGADPELRARLESQVVLCHQLAEFSSDQGEAVLGALHWVYMCMCVHMHVYVCMCGFVQQCLCAREVTDLCFLQQTELLQAFHCASNSCVPISSVYSVWNETTNALLANRSTFASWMS